MNNVNELWIDIDKEFNKDDETFESATLTSQSYYRELNIKQQQVLFALPKSSASSISFKLYVPTDIILVHLPPC